MARANFYIESFQLKTPYTIIFEGNISSDTSPFGVARVEFSGADIRSTGTSTMHDEILSPLKESLAQVYGYGRYDEAEVEELLKNNNAFHIKY